MAYPLRRSSRSYDERGRLWETSDLFKEGGTTHGDAVTTYARLKTGQVTEVTNPRSEVSDISYDSHHRVDTTTDAEGNEGENGYDSNGNRTSWSVTETDGTNSVTFDYEATYDALNRMLARVEVDRTDSQNRLTTTYAYNSRSNLVWMVDSENNPTRWTFDGLGRMTERERALTTGETIEDFTTKQDTQWAFDRNNRVTSFKDDGAHESTWTYDALDRPSTMTYPDSSGFSYGYDANDNLTGVTDPAGNETTNTYNDANERTSRSVDLATGFSGTTSETWTYDALGNVLTAADNDYKVTFEYSALGLSSPVHTEKQEYVGGTAYAKTVTMTYDAAGNKSTEAYPGNLTLAYAYNAIDLLTSITDSSSNTIVSTTYQGIRPLVSTFQNGTTDTRTYGGFHGEVTTIHHETSSPATLLRLDYAYDGNHDKLYERYGASGASGDAFEYDGLRRLATAWMGSADVTDPSNNNYVKKIEYTLDDDGNRSSVAVTPWQQSQTSTSYTSNTLNQYTSVGGTSQSHDANGNLTDNGTYLFVYDYKNQIVQVKLKSTQATVATYKYDPLGRRVEKAVTAGITERYVYSDLETIETYNAYDTLQQSFVYGQGIDHIVMLEQADILDFDNDSNTTELTRSFYHRNALGSVLEITDMNEAEVESFRYDRFGVTTITIGGVQQSYDVLGQHWAYTGEFCDEETGLYYLGARCFSPLTGSFLQRDSTPYLDGEGAPKGMGGLLFGVAFPPSKRGPQSAPPNGIPQGWVQAKPGRLSPYPNCAACGPAGVPQRHVHQWETITYTVDVRTDWGAWTKKSVTRVDEGAQGRILVNEEVFENGTETEAGIDADYVFTLRAVWVDNHKDVWSSARYREHRLSWNAYRVDRERDGTHYYYSYEAEQCKICGEIWLEPEGTLCHEAVHEDETIYAVEEARLNGEENWPMNYFSYVFYTYEAYQAWDSGQDVLVVGPKPSSAARLRPVR